jgi:hypothetical protein
MYIKKIDLMKFLHFIILILFSCNVNKSVIDNSSDFLYDVHIQVTSTSSYCGGAYPPDDLLEKLRTPNPLSNVEVFIRRGEDNDFNNPIIFAGQSDENGDVKCKLPEGNYALVFKEKSNSDYYNSLLEMYNEDTEFRSKINVDCLNSYIKTPDLLMNISAKSKLIFKVNKHKECSWSNVPCSSYKGPLPPSAAPG